MAQIPDHIKKTLDAYVQALAKEINVKSAFVFGSYACGNWREDSDIDIAIFSEHFSNMDRVQAITFLLNRTLPYNLDIQPVAFDEQDLAPEAENPFVSEILKIGIKIA